MTREITNQFLASKGFGPKEIKSYFKRLKQLRKAINPNLSLVDAHEKMFELPGGLRFFYQEWVSPRTEFQEKPRAVIFAFHNIYGSSDIFYPWADYLTNKGFMVIGMDYRGHGRTGGQAGGILGDITSFKDIFLDALELINICKKKYEVPIIFAGYDIGGLIAMNLTKTDRKTPPMVDGLILISPIWKLKENIKHITLYPLLSIGSLFTKAENQHTVIDEVLENTYYAEYQDYAQKNHLRLKTMSYRFFKSILDIIRKTHHLGKKLDVPCIIFQGTQDSIVDHYSVLRLYEKWKHPIKKIRLFENTGHNLLNDKFTHDLYDESADFIENLIEKKQVLLKN
jgi:alpha-beta hydrolase superfamily lysophospholipase